MGKKIYLLSVFDGLLQAFLLHIMMEFSMSTYVNDLFSAKELILRLVTTIISVGFFCFIVRKEPNSKKRYAALVLSVLAMILYNQFFKGNSTHVFDFFEYRTFESRAYGFYLMFSGFAFSVLHIILRMIGMAVFKKEEYIEADYETEEIEESEI